MDGDHRIEDKPIRYASEEDRRKAEALAASLDAAMEDLDRNGPVTPEQFKAISTSVQPG